MPRIIAFFIFDQFQLLDAAGPIAAFEMPMQGMTPSPYAIQVLSREGGLVTSSSGAALLSIPMASAGHIDTLVIAGGDGVEQSASCAETLAFVRLQAQRARRLCSVCSGAYILAAAGLLDGRQTTTHWSRTADFANRFPKVKFLPDQIYTQDGAFWTSAGITAGIDLALALIADDHGDRVAKLSARQLVVYQRRGKGQSQFSTLLEHGTAQGRLAPLLPWIREHLSTPLTVGDLAAQACMSERNFARAFAAELGMTPAKAVEKIRLEVARELIETGTHPFDAVAETSGFRDTERMRKAFLRHFGQPPQALRRTARGAAPPAAR